MALPAGLLRELVVIEYPLETRNSLGEAIQTWHEYARRRCHVEAVGYIEQTRRQQIGGSVSHVVRMRYCEGLTGMMRLRWVTRGGRILQITGVVERNNREEHEVQAEERAT